MIGKRLLLLVDNAQESPTRITLRGNQPNLDARLENEDVAPSLSMKNEQIALGWRFGAAG
jgi:hypothetical protein